MLNEESLQQCVDRLQLVPHAWQSTFVHVSLTLQSRFTYLPFCCTFYLLLRFYLYSLNRYLERRNCYFFLSILGLHCFSRRVRTIHSGSCDSANTPCPDDDDHVGISAYYLIVKKQSNFIGSRTPHLRNDFDQQLHSINRCFLLRTKSTLADVKQQLTRPKSRWHVFVPDQNCTVNLALQREFATTEK